MQILRSETPTATRSLKRRRFRISCGLAQAPELLSFSPPQQATRARAYGDLTRFHDVLYAHLSLVEAERLRTDLMRELEEQFEIQRLRSEDLQSTEDKLRAQLKDVDARLEEILRSPPWGIRRGPYAFSLGPADPFVRSGSSQ